MLSTPRHKCHHCRPNGFKPIYLSVCVDCVRVCVFVWTFGRRCHQYNALCNGLVCFYFDRRCCRLSVVYCVFVLCHLIDLRRLLCYVQLAAARSAARSPRSGTSRSAGSGRRRSGRGNGDWCSARRVLRRADGDGGGGASPEGRRVAGERCVLDEATGAAGAAAAEAERVAGDGVQCGGM